MVSSIGSAASSIFQDYLSLQSSDTYSTKQAQSFDELLSNGTVSSGEDASSTGITSMGGSSGSCGAESNSSNSEMDLNGDGTVTIDEIMQYTAMQMMEQMKEQMAADEGSEQMGQQSGQDAQQQKFDMNNFKTQMASQAYQMGENLLSASIGSVTQSFTL